jgi:hypothetical protein
MGFFEAFFGVLERDQKLVFNTGETKVDSSRWFNFSNRLKKMPLPSH